MSTKHGSKGHLLGGLVSHPPPPVSSETIAPPPPPPLIQNCSSPPPPSEVVMDSTSDLAWDNCTVRWRLLLPHGKRSTLAGGWLRVPGDWLRLLEVGWGLVDVGRLLEAGWVLLSHTSDVGGSY